MNDYEVVVAGLSRMLAPYADRVVVVELNSQTTTITPVDVLLYDAFSRARVDEAVQSVLATTRARTVLYTWNTEPHIVEDCLIQGMSAVVSKESDADELVRVLESVAAGREVESPAEVHGDVARGDWPGRAAGLSARESEVIALIAQGLSNQEIATRSFLSINSIKTYIRSSYRKIGVERRTQAVIWARSNGFEPDRVRHLL